MTEQEMVEAQLVYDGLAEVNEKYTGLTDEEKADILLRLLRDGITHDSAGACVRAYDMELFLAHMEKLIVQSGSGHLLPRSRFSPEMRAAIERANHTIQ